MPAIATRLSPPLPTAWREPLLSEFSPARARALEPVIQVRCAELIDAVAGRGSCDFVGEFARRLPVAVFLTMLDLPQTELDRFLAWAEAATRPGGEAVIPEAVRGYFAELITSRRADPGDDLVSRMNTWPVDGREPDREELTGLLFALLTTGLDTGSAQLSHAFRHLATHPAHRDRVVREPEIIPGAVAEMLRQVGAGRGIQRVGAHLALQETQVAVREWHRRIPDYRIPAELQACQRDSGRAGGESLPLCWDGVHR